MKRTLLLCLAGITLLAAQEPAAPAASAPALPAPRPHEPGRFKALFQPFRTNLAALSPDGRHLAYTVREGEILSVVIVDIDHPEVMKARVQVMDDDAASPMLDIDQKEKTPGRINWMRWVSPTRLVLETNHLFARTTGPDAVWQGWKGAVFAFDADGTNAKLLARPSDLLEFADDASGEGAFNPRRTSTRGFEARVMSPDRPIGQPGTGGANADAGPALPAAGDTDTPPGNPWSGQPRSLRIFDLDPQRPGAVTLIATGGARTTGTRSLGLYSLDTQTGKLTELTDDLVLGNRTALLDRQGHIRLTLPNSLLTSFPFRYTYLGPKGQGRPKPLDELPGLAGFSVSPDNYFGTRAIPLGFDENPNLLYFAANTGRDTYGVYTYDFAAGKRGGLTMENTDYDLIDPPTDGFPDQNNLVFDRFRHQLAGVRYNNALRTTAWIRPEWQKLQADFEQMFPGRSVEITDWDEAGNRFVLATQGPADPGAFFVFDRAKNKLMEFVRRAPWIDANHVHVTLPFAYATQDGARVSGLITVPRQPHLKPIPMVVLCPDLPWQRVRSDFQTEVQALADMGFVVVQLNGRGAWGLGLKQRTSLTTGYDLVQIDDIITTIAGLEQLFKVNPRRVALLGRGHGGFIALRALQAHPDKFRCAIALNAPVDLADWLAVQRWSNDDVQPHLTRAWLGDPARLKADPLRSHPEALTKPVMMLNYPGPEGAPHRTDYAQARSFAGKVRSKGTTVEFADLTTDYMNGLPAARAAVFDRIEEFLNVNVYDFKVELKELKIIK